MADIQKKNATTLTAQIMTALAPGHENGIRRPEKNTEKKSCLRTKSFMIAPRIDAIAPASAEHGTRPDKTPSTCHTLKYDSSTGKHKSQVLQKQVRLSSWNPELTLGHSHCNVLKIRYKLHKTK
jgi:hypothetical protein